jgi:YidC/Oxa1 family membrane protein insertase
MHKMMMWMPVMFGFFLYNYAAGLSVYMITQSGLGILEQTVIKKVWPVDNTEKPKKRSGFMARLADLQKQAQQQQRGGAGKGASKNARRAGKRRSV